MYKQNLMIIVKSGLQVVFIPIKLYMYMGELKSGLNSEVFFNQGSIVFIFYLLLQ